MQQLATLSPLHCAMLAGCQDAAQVSEAWEIAMLWAPIHTAMAAACDRCNDELSDGNPGVCSNCMAGSESASAARIERLEAALRSAREALSDWGMYVSDHMRAKHGFDADMAEIDAALAEANSLGPAGQVSLSGRLISIGNLPECDAPAIIGRPHILMRMADHTVQGRLVLISGLSTTECRDLVHLLERDVSVTIGRQDHK